MSAWRLVGCGHNPHPGPSLLVQARQPGSITFSQSGQAHESEAASELVGMRLYCCVFDRVH